MTSPQLPAVDMRHTKLKPEEAALIAGELVKPCWASRNEGIHERVSFEDTLWGFEMAGGAYYNTPLRIAYVKPGSRAEQACIRMGDQVLRIQGIDTSTLTLQEAHQLVQDAGIDLKIAVTSPDDKFDAHYEYQDPLMTDGGLTPEQLQAMERERVQKAIAKAIRCRDLEWPWVRRKFIIYRESNCFLVPSKFENNHRDQFPELPSQKVDYFFPMEKLDKVKSSSKQNGDTEPKRNGSKNDDIEEEEEEYVSEEELEEDANEEELEQEESNKRLIEESSQRENLKQKENMGHLKNKIENELDEASEEKTQNNSIRKDSEGSTIYELDNNNNHVNKSKVIETPKNSKDNSENVENSSETIDDDLDNPESNIEVDEVINEIVKTHNDLNTNEILNSDDEIINNILNGDEDTLIER